MASPLWGQNPVDPEAKTGYYNSLYHSAAIVGLNTSAFLEGAIVGRPVFATLLPEHHENQEGTIHFHYLLTVGAVCCTRRRTLAGACRAAQRVADQRCTSESRAQPPVR